MAEAIFSGILRSGLVPPANVLISDIREECLNELKQRYGVIALQAGADNGGTKRIMSEVDVVVLAMQPQAVGPLLHDIKGHFNAKRHLVLSIMGGVTLEYLESFILEAPVIRIMPNTPMLVQTGVAGIALGKNAEPVHGRLACEIFDAVGISYLLPEALIDPLTGISGCGPAFAGVFIQALADGGVELGLPRDMAIRIAAQTVVGTGKMVLETNQHPEILKDNVCTPAGGTIAGVRALEMRAFRGTVISAVEDSVERMRDVGDKA